MRHMWSGKRAVSVLSGLFCCWLRQYRIWRWEHVDARRKTKMCSAPGGWQTEYSAYKMLSRHGKIISSQRPCSCIEQDLHHFVVSIAGSHPQCTLTASLNMIHVSSCVEQDQHHFFVSAEGSPPQCTLTAIISNTIHASSCLD
eukprot:GEMP01131566.1.p1 GENE.GEMP01131566.1~~GEMP01131566.1.p1  ORF type:complete len:143 (-),score=13.53 GEMP01131566.1:4-432(-)